MGKETITFLFEESEQQLISAAIETEKSGWDLKNKMYGMEIVKKVNQSYGHFERIELKVIQSALTSFGVRHHRLGNKKIANTSFNFSGKISIAITRMLGPQAKRER